MADEFWLAEYGRKAALDDPIAQTGRGGQFQTPELLASIRQALELLELDRRHHLLDVGCGNGLVDVVLSACCASVTAIEPVEALYEHACRNTAACRNIRVIRAEGTCIPAENAVFDRVLLLNVLQLVPRDEVASLAAELKRVTRPGGRIVFAAVPDGRRREAFLTPYLAGVRGATHLSNEQKQAIIERNERAVWHDPRALARWFVDCGGQAEIVALADDDPDREHRFHLVIEVGNAAARTTRRRYQVTK